MTMDLPVAIENLYEMDASEINDKDFRSVFQVLISSLNQGKIRAAEKRGDTWIVNSWVKKGILLGFRMGRIQKISLGSNYVFYDKDTYPLKSIIP